jgi:dethiobiotin synthetase
VARRIFLVGTDTDCGKTTVACALLRAAVAAGVRALPFKPAASGPVDERGDPERLVAAAGLAGLTAAEICPLRYAAPVAPGLAEAGGSEMSLWAGPKGQVSGEPRLASEMSLWAGPKGQVPEQLGRVEARLEELERRYAPELTIIEGAGGLWVPMPGGSWLPAWISGLAAAPVVVGRLGLGTINHCLLTIAALRQIGLAPRGFVLAQTSAAVEPSQAHNEGVIAAASGLACLGVLSFGTGLEEHAWLRGGVARLLG